MFYLVVLGVIQYVLLSLSSFVASFDFLPSKIAKRKETV